MSMLVNEHWISIHYPSISVFIYYLLLKKKPLMAEMVEFVNL